MAESDSEAAYIYTTSKSLTAIEAQATLIGIVSNDLTDAPKSEAFLNRSISALTRFRDETKRGEIRSVAAMNLGLAYVQLANIQEKQSKRADAQRSMTEAQAILRRLGWPDCSEANLKRVSQERVDRFRIGRNQQKEQR